MTVKMFDSNINITLTDNAKIYFEKEMAKQDKRYITLSLKKSGCTGYAYDISYTDENDLDFYAIKMNKGTLLINRESISKLNGLTIDLSVNGLNKTIEFINPNVVDKCGCGQSVGF